MPKGYTDKAAVEAYLGTASPVTESILNTYIEAAEAQIDRLTGRNFKADSTASARLYGGDGSETLNIDECIAVSKVEVGLDTYGGSFLEVAATGADRFFPLPENATARAVPIFSVSLSARCFPEGTQNNRITAKWGYSAAPPSDIMFAATVLAAGIAKFKADGGVNTERIGQYSVSYGTDAKAMSDFAEAKRIVESYRVIQL